MLLVIKIKNKKNPQEVVQWVRTTPNEVEVTSSNPPPLSCVDMLKKKKKKKKKIHNNQYPINYNHN